MSSRKPYPVLHPWLPMSLGYHRIFHSYVQNLQQGRLAQAWGAGEVLGERGMETQRRELPLQRAETAQAQCPGQTLHVKLVRQAFQVLPFPTE